MAKKNTEVESRKTSGYSSQLCEYEICNLWLKRDRQRGERGQERRDKESAGRGKKIKMEW